MKNYYIILKSGYFLTCTEKATFRENGQMNEQKVEIYTANKVHLGSSDDFSLNKNEICMSFWKS